MDFSLTNYSTDRSIHAKLIWLAIRTNSLSRLSYLGGSILKLRNQISLRWIYLKISFIIKSWWLSWLHQYGSFQALYLPEWQIKNSNEENLQDKLGESQNFILLLSLERSKVIVHRLEKNLRVLSLIKELKIFSKSPLRDLSNPSIFLTDL